MGKRLNPDASSMDIEKQFYKNKGKFSIEELPFDVPMRNKPASVNIEKEVSFDTSREVKPSSRLSGLNLARPVPKKGVKFSSEVSVRPVGKEVRKPNRSSGDVNAIERPARTVPNVILRKPGFYKEDDSENAKLERLNMSIKPNLNLKMVNDLNKEQFTDMTLLRKPSPVNDVVGSGQTLDSVSDSTQISDQQPRESFTMLKKPEPLPNIDDVNDEDPSMYSEDVNVDHGVPESGYQVERPSTWEQLQTTSDFQGLIESTEESLIEQPQVKEESFLGIPFQLFYQIYFCIMEP